MATQYDRPLCEPSLTRDSVKAFNLHTSYQQPFYITPPDLSTLERLRTLHHTDEMVARDRVDHRSHTYVVLRDVTGKSYKTKHWLAVQHGGGVEFCALDLMPYREAIIVRQLLELDAHDAFWFADTLIDTAKQSYGAGRYVALHEVLKAKIAGTLKFPRKRGHIGIDLHAQPKKSRVTT